MKMQDCEENHLGITKEKPNRPKVTARYPTRIPAYVVAYSVQDTFNEMSSTQDNMNNKQSDQSNKSMSSSDSTKTRTLEESLLTNYVQDSSGEVPSMEDIQPSAQSNRNNDTSIPVTTAPETSNYLPMNTDAYQYGDVRKITPETTIYFIDDMTMEDNSNVRPQVIFNSIRSRSKCAPRRKSKNINHSIIKKNTTIRNLNIKNKQNNQRTRIAKYYCKINKRNTYSLNKNVYSNSALKIISRSGILRKVSAKENLFEENNEDLGLFIYEDASSTSSPSTIKKGSFSCSSQATLTHKSSETSSRQDEHNEIPPENLQPYKSDVINVGVAVTYNKPLVNTINNIVITDDRERFIFRDSLTSTETITGLKGPLTDCVPLNVIQPSTDEKYMNSINLNVNDMSDQTLIGRDMDSNASSKADTFVITKTSSEFQKFNYEASCDSAMSNSESFVNTETLSLNPPTLCNSPDKAASALLDTVRKVGMCPEVNPSTSASTSDQSNSVIIAEDKRNIFNISLKGKGDDPTPKITKNIFKKMFDTDITATGKKYIVLPDEAVIQSMINKEHEYKRSCTEESRMGEASNLPEFWDKLVLILDLTIKRLEESLVDKIVSEIRKSLPASEQTIPPADTIVYSTATGPIIIPEKVVIDKEVLVSREVIDIEPEKGMQCDLVQNQVIDQLMFNLSVDNPLAILKTKPKLTKPTLAGDYFEILKPPVEKPKLEVDIEAASTLPPGVATENTYRRYQGLNKVMMMPLIFLSNNIMVFSSVPVFLVVLYTIYSFLVIVIRAY